MNIGFLCSFFELIFVSEVSCNWKLCNLDSVVYCIREDRFI